MQAMLALLRTFSWQDLRHHPWRSAAAVAAVMLGVALAFAVHVINASALDEFSQAVRAVNGQPDLELRAMQGDLPEALRTQLPALKVTGATHSNNPAYRMAIVNGQVLHEGDQAAPGLVLEKIEPGRTVWSFKGYRYGVAAQ